MTNEFGTQLRERRLAAGLSISQLASRVHFTKGYLSKLENGRRTPTPATARLCDAALDAGGALAALVSNAVPTVMPDGDAEREPDELDHEVWLMAMDQAGVLRFGHLDRRQVLAAGTAALLGFGVARGARPPAPDERVVPGLHASFDQMRRIGMISSPLVVLPSVICHVKVLRCLAADADGPVRAQMDRLSARVAEYAGWMYQEAGDLRRARWWTDYAIRLASRGGDADLCRYALVRHAEMAVYGQDPVEAIQLACRAQQTTVDARVLGLAARCEGQAHALAGDLGGFRRAMDRAATLLAAPVAQAPAPLPLGSSSVPDQVALTTGSSLYELGRVAEAVEVLDREVVRISDTARRARARFGVRRVLAHAASGAVDRACELLPAALEDAVHVDSATVRIDLREAHRVLSRRRGHPEVRELLPQLATVMREPVG